MIRKEIILCVIFAAFAHIFIVLVLRNIESSKLSIFDLTFTPFMSLILSIIILISMFLTYNKKKRRIELSPI